MCEQPLEIVREGRALFPLTLVRAGTANPQPLIELPLSHWLHARAVALLPQLTDLPPLLY